MILELLLALSPADYDHLARAVQVEAAPNTMDEYCVAVSILNRVKSPKFPNSVADVVYAPGQYEGFRYWRPAAKPEVVARLKDNTKMQIAYSIIKDRTDFKGQSQLPYRVVSEDPMCAGNGNFFHYYWQT
tara:strand:- start:506 stop:895 length:390 start_codon:yes stop_codon:yes gene_type:complete